MRSQPTPPSVIGAQEAAEILGIDRTTLTRWVRRGEVRPTQKLPGANGAFLYDRDEIQGLAAARRAREGTTA